MKKVILILFTIMLYVIPSNAQQIIIASIDNGITEQDEWEKCLWKNKNEIPDNGIDDDGNGYIDDVIGWNFYKNNNDVFIKTNEITHGDISVKKLYEILIDNCLCGYNFKEEIKIMPIKIMEGDICHTKFSSTEEGIRYAIKNGAQIINMPIENDKIPKITSALEKMIKEYKNVQFVFGSGNNNEDLDRCDKLLSYCDYDNVYVLGACSVEGKKIDYSNYGKNSVDFFVNLESEEGIVHFQKGNVNCKIDGTSFCTPYVSVCIAIMRYVDPNLTSKTIKQMIKDNLDISGELTEYCKTSGILNINRAIEKMFTENEVAKKQIEQRIKLYYLIRESNKRVKEEREKNEVYQY